MLGVNRKMTILNTEFGQKKSLPNRVWFGKQQTSKIQFLAGNMILHHPFRFAQAHLTHRVWFGSPQRTGFGLEAYRQGHGK
jgi:hypothetical protein